MRKQTDGAMRADQHFSQVPADSVFLQLPENAEPRVRLFHDSNRLVTISTCDLEWFETTIC